ncbi:MAG: hypothetical protein PUD59_00625 [bacterium]|nr:hypothetical protein [bacterium]
MKIKKTNDESTNKERKKFKITEIFTNKRYYAIANLIFYPIVFLILIIIVRNGQSTTHNEVDNVPNYETNVYALEKINEKNFNFRYILNIDDEKIVYAGKMYNNKILFEDKSNNNIYYIQDNLVLQNINGNYSVVENPVKYFNYFDVELINKIFDKSTEDDGDYIISISDFIRVIKSEEFVDENEILIEIEKQENMINKITLDLTDYINDVELKNVNSATLELNYYDFGLIKDFNIN